MRCSFVLHERRDAENKHVQHDGDAERVTTVLVAALIAAAAAVMVVVLVAIAFV
jgi:hypothetical protein